MDSVIKKIPKHVAIIMDGNGRWAQLKGLDRIEGHRVGVEVSEDIITYASELGIDYLTLYSFSKENWSRPASEVTALMELLRTFLIQKCQKMLDNGIRLNTIGDLSLIPKPVVDVLNEVKLKTKVGSKMVLTLALSYGSRDEILRGIKKIVRECLEKKNLPESFNESDFSGYLDTVDLPDPDLIIRTSGEQRTSNFLLWQSAYAEYFFEECYWPDFSPEHLMKAILEYQTRERRFGKTGEQVRKD